MRKASTLSKLAAMPQSQQDALLHWLEVDKLTYPQTVARLKKEFGITSAPSSICEWRQRCLSQAGKASPASTGQTVFEIVITAAAPNTLRLKIISNAAIQIENGAG